MTMPKLLVTPFADEGLKNSIPVSAEPDALANTASYKKGFPQATMTPVELGGMPPSGKDMNGILHELSAHIAYLNKGGNYTFDADFAELIGGYSIGSVVQSDDGQTSYVSQVNGNKTNPNNARSSGWAIFAGKKSNEFFKAELLKRSYQVASVEELRKFKGSDVTKIVQVAGYYANSTVGGGIFVADARDKSTADNGGTVIVAADGTRWKRQIEGGRVTLADFGILPDGSDVGAAINKAFEACAGLYLLAADAGTYLTSVELKAPTGLRFSGAGMYRTLIKAAPSLPAIANLLTNKSNNYGTRTAYDHSIHISDIAIDADWRGRYSIGAPINNQACGVKFSAVRLSSLINVRVINAALHCFDICADQYVDTGDVTANATNQSEHILLRGCVAANPYRDDAFTTHNSRHITFEDCIALFDGSVSSIGNTQQGFEADEGSSNVVFKKCYAKGYHCGYQSKGHATTRPAEAVSLIDCEADGCAYGAMASVGANPGGKSGYKPQSVAIRGLTVSNPSGNAHLANPIALHVYGADGVLVDGITINGSANIVVEQGAGMVDMRNIIFKDPLAKVYAGLVELRRTLTATADIRISNLTVKALQPIPVIHKDSSAFRMILDGGWISGTSASDVEAIRLRRSPRDVVKGLLSGLKNTVYLVTEGLYLTGDVQLDTYNRIYLTGNPVITTPILKAPIGTVSTSQWGEQWVQRSTDPNAPNWVKTVN